MPKYLLLALLFLIYISATTGQAQSADTTVHLTGKHKYLLLASTNSVTRYRLYAGEEITVQLVGDKRFYSGQLQQIRSASFVFQNTDIPLQRVAAVQLQSHTGARKVANFGGYFLKGAGTVFVPVGAINVLANSEDRQDGFITIGAALTSYAAGMGLHVLRKGTYRIGKKWQLKVVEMY